MRDLEIIAKAAATAIATAACGLVFATSAAAAPACDTFAHTSGSGSAAGTHEDPFETAQQALDAAGPNGTACLREGGTFKADDEVRLDEPNQTLTSAPGERAKLKTRVYVTKYGDGSTVSDLDIDGRSPRENAFTINGDDVTVRGNDITNHHTEICIIVGSPDPQWGRAHDTLIEDNKIHNCGELPATNFDHGVYVSAADRTVIRNNWIYDNADRGIQMYSDADHTKITGNVIDGNGQGVIFGGDETTSDHNTVENNVITNSEIRDNVESSWGNGGPGNDNVARNNCVGGGAYDDGDGGIMGGAPSKKGFTASNNLITSDPGYADRGGKNFELDPSSPCAEILAGAATKEVDADEVDSGSGGKSSKGGKKKRGKRKPTIKVNRKRVSSGSKLKVKGRAGQAKKVTIQRKKRGSWKRVGKIRVKGSGRYKTKMRARGNGKLKLRAKAPGGKSKPVKVKVRRS